MRTRKAYYVEQIDCMTEERKIVGSEFRNKKYAISLLKDLEKIGIMSTPTIFKLRERYLN